MTTDVLMIVKIISLMHVSMRRLFHPLRMDTSVGFKSLKEEFMPRK